MAVSFLNSFLSYLVVLIVIAAVGAVAITLGITLRKKKNKKECVQNIIGYLKTNGFKGTFKRIGEIISNL